MININKHLLFSLVCVALFHVAGLTLSLPSSMIVPDDPSVGVVLVHWEMESPAVASSQDAEIVPSATQSARDVADVDTTVERKNLPEPLPEPRPQKQAEHVPDLKQKEETIVAPSQPEPVMLTEALVNDKDKNRDGELSSEPGSELKTVDHAEKSATKSAPALVGSTNIEQKAQPRYGYHPPPSYPRLARQRGWQGTVEYEVKVLPDGVVGELVLKTSSGYKSLDDAARNAIAKWRFNPATRSGTPVESWVVIPVSFILDANRDN